MHTKKIITLQVVPRVGGGADRNIPTLFRLGYFGALQGWGYTMRMKLCTSIVHSKINKMVSIIYS